MAKVEKNKKPATFLDVVVYARKLINKPEKWCQRAFAQDRDGIVINLKDKDAVRFCAVGAIKRAMYDLNYDVLLSEYTDKMDNVFGPIWVKLSGRWTFMGFNDNSDHKTVMKAFTMAVKKLKEQEAGK